MFLGGTRMINGNRRAYPNGRPPRPAPRWWPLALLLLSAFLGHDVMMTQNVAAQVSDLSQASTHSSEPAAHHPLVDPGPTTHHPPDSHHVAGCGEVRPAVARASDSLLLLRGATLAVASSDAEPSHPLRVVDSSIPIPPPAVRRALLQVFLI